jgi:hypothetical protein
MASFFIGTNVAGIDMTDGGKGLKQQRVTSFCVLDFLIITFE